MTPFASRSSASSAGSALRCFSLRLGLACILPLLAPLTDLSAATRSQKGPVVPKWGRFEHTFKSSISYSNPVQQASVQVIFTSPEGKANHVDGFWDGGSTWKVRFAPDQVGRWSFQTSCSDVANGGLHNQTGSLICTAGIPNNPFQRHGPVKIARDRRHFEHADGTPFFWMADTIWNAPLVSDSKDFSGYAVIRAGQGFSVAQWSLAPGSNYKAQRAWVGSDRISINADFFQKLDGKIETLTRAGLLSAIAPLNELESISPLPEDQAALLLRYAIARWNADPVAWLLLFEGDGRGRQASRWKKIGQAVFGNAEHAPVILFTGETPWLLNEFREQRWVDAFGYQTLADVSDDAVKWALSGPLSTEWMNQPPHPIIPFTPAENSPMPTSKKRFSADDVRQAAWWSLLLSVPAGVSYSAQGVSDWDATTGSPGKRKTTDLPLWRKSLFLPGAKQMAHVSRFMTAIDYWQLRPRPEYVATQPGNISPRAFVASASTDDKSPLLAYTPHERTLEIVLDSLPRSPAISWFNPRTGQTNAAVAVVSSTYQFPTPDAGDWLLFVLGGR